MYTPVYTRQFERDMKHALRRGTDPEKLKNIVRTLLSGRPLGPLHRDHRLVGRYTGRRECHLEANWLLIYKVDETRLVFEWKGTHTGLCKR